MTDLSQPDPNLLKELVKYKMPFGKHKDTLLIDLPVTYLEWFQRQGFPAGKLGMLLSTLYEIRLNGLEHILQNIRRMG